MDTLIVDESFFTSEDAPGLKEFARCADCLARSAAELEGQSLVGEEAAKLQWSRCAQCRCGTHDWYPR